jgi:hypothetical protein
MAKLFTYDEIILFDGTVKSYRFATKIPICIPVRYTVVSLGGKVRSTCRVRSLEVILSKTADRHGLTFLKLEVL